MWLRLKDIKKATGKTIGYVIGIVVYRFIVTDLPQMLSLRSSEYISVWGFGSWGSINVLNWLVYTIFALLILSAWIGGAVFDLVAIIAGFIVYFVILAPNGTAGIRFSFGYADVFITIGLLPVFIVYVVSFLLLLAVNIFKGYDAYRDACFTPVVIDNYKLSPAEKRKIADYLEITRMSGSAPPR